MNYGLWYTYHHSQTSLENTINQIINNWDRYIAKVCSVGEHKHNHWAELGISYDRSSSFDESLGIFLGLATTEARHHKNGLFIPKHHENHYANKILSIILNEFS